MKRVTFVFNKDGKERAMKQKMALHLQKAGKGLIKNTYLTRDMVPARTVEQQSVTPQTQTQTQEPVDEKDTLITELAGRGIYKDKRTSVEKLRELLAE